MESWGKSFVILSLVPGRMRIHLTGWTGKVAERIEKRFRQIKGIESVRVNPRTENVLIHFDCRTIKENRLLRELDMAWDECAEHPIIDPPPSSFFAPHSPVIRAGVRGLLGHAVVDSLWFSAGFLGQSIGLPLAWLGPLHLLMDLAVWTMAFRSVKSRSAAQVGPRNPVTPLAPRTPVDAASV